MKMLIILSINETADEVRKILKNNKVPVYSETDIHGFKTSKYQPDLDNWFGSSNGGVFSKLFFTFHDGETLRDVMQAIKTFNEEKEQYKEYPLHAFQLNVEDTV